MREEPLRASAGRGRADAAPAARGAGRSAPRCHSARSLPQLPPVRAAAGVPVLSVTTKGAASLSGAVPRPSLPFRSQSVSAPPSARGGRRAGLHRSGRSSEKGAIASYQKEVRRAVRRKCEPPAAASFCGGSLASAPSSPRSPAPSAWPPPLFSLRMPGLGGIAAVTHDRHSSASDDLSPTSRPRRRRRAPRWRTSPRTAR